MGEKLESGLGCAIALLILAFGFLQIIAGWAGIEHAYGAWWAAAAILVGVFFRFTLPIAFGAFLCAKDIWGWHWFFAAIFAAPGLLFMVPAFVSSVIDAIRR